MKVRPRPSLAVLVFLAAGALAPCAVGKGAASPPEAELASLRLGATLPPALRCPAAIPNEIETIHQFRAAGLGVDGKDAFLVVMTECTKEQCSSDAERVVLSIWVQGTAEPKSPTCPLSPSVRLVTSAGLRLGDPVARVGLLYGKPHHATPRKGALKGVDYAGRVFVPGLDRIDVGFSVDFKAGRVDRMALYVDTDPH